MAARLFPGIVVSDDGPLEWVCGKRCLIYSVGSEFGRDGGRCICIRKSALAVQSNTTHPNARLLRKSSRKPQRSAAQSQLLAADEEKRYPRAPRHHLLVDFGSKAGRVHCRPAAEPPHIVGRLPACGAACFEFAASNRGECGRTSLLLICVRTFPGVTPRPLVVSPMRLDDTPLRSSLASCRLGRERAAWSFLRSMKTPPVLDRLICWSNKEPILTVSCGRHAFVGCIVLCYLS